MDPRHVFLVSFLDEMSKIAEEHPEIEKDAFFGQALALGSRALLGAGKFLVNPQTWRAVGGGLKTFGRSALRSIPQMAGWQATGSTMSAFRRPQ